MLDVPSDQSLTRVLHVVNWLRRGGVETQLLRILRDYDRDRFGMDVCCIGAAEGDLADAARSSGARLLRCRKSANFWSFARRFSRLLEGRGYDVVHSHFGAWSGPILRGARRAGVPVRIAHMRNSIPLGREQSRRLWGRSVVGSLAAWGMNWTRRDATRVLGVSRAALDSLWPGWQAELEHFGVWTAGVDLVRFAPSPELPSSAGGPVVVNVGSLNPAKNQSLLLEAFARLRERIPGAELRVVGAGPEEARLRMRAEQGDLRGSVRFLGLRDDIPELLREAGVFATASRLEGLPNVVIEAQAAGVPVVASDIPPHREAVPIANHTNLFPLDEPEAATDRIAALLGSPAMRREASEAGRRHVEKRYDFSHNLSVLENWYEEWTRSSREGKGAR